MANWFIGIPIAPANWFEAILPVPPGCRAFAPTDLHLTIIFLGHVTEEEAFAAWDKLEWKLPAMEVTLGNVVPMGNPKRYSALSALLHEGREQVEAAINAAHPSERPAKAHITVARPKRKATSQERERALEWADALVIPDVRIKLESIALYTWAEDRSETLFRIISSRTS